MANAQRQLREGEQIIKERWTNPLAALNQNDADGNPTGGSVEGVGLNIQWQNGPLGWDKEKNSYPEGMEPNGAFSEDVILAVVQRLKFFQDSQFKSRENACAITHLEEALMWLQRRHDNRVVRGVQGEHKV